MINDFKKREKEHYEKNDKRVELMRDSFLAFVSWETTASEISEMEKVSKAEIIKIANKYYGENYVCGFRMDAQHDLPSIEKPPIDPLSIDPNKGSVFMSEVENIPFDPLSPKFIQSGEDFTVHDIEPGIRLIHVYNPLNDLFNLEVRMEMGFDHQPLLSFAKRMLDRAGSGKLNSEELKIEWYKLGTDFGFGIHEHFSNFNLNGLDENFLATIQLAQSHFLSPNSSDEIWNLTKEIITSERDDEQKDPNSLTHALAHYHRYGEKSRYIKRASDEELNASSVGSLSNIVAKMINSPRTILYFGPKSPEEILRLLGDTFLLSKPTHSPTPTSPDRSLDPVKNQVFFVHKEMAQSQVRLEFSSGLLDESLTPSVQLFNEYFGGGMAGFGVSGTSRSTGPRLFCMGSLFYSFPTHGRKSSGRFHRLSGRQDYRRCFCFP